jgi:hypothetical protein
MNKIVEVALENVIKQVRKGYVFDNHYVIRTMDRRAYNILMNETKGSNTHLTRIVHARIGKAVAAYIQKSGKARRLTDKNNKKIASWSENWPSDKSIGTSISAAWIKN